MRKFLALSLSDVAFIMLINVKMPTIYGILTFISRINFVLSRVEHEKSLITSGTGILFATNAPGELFSCCGLWTHCFSQVYLLGSLFLKDKTEKP